MKKINPKEADNIIKSLEAGVVPKKGIRHLLVGRNEEVKEVLSILEKITNEMSDIRFWVGDFGSGKSFMLQTISAIGLDKNFIVSTVDLTPTRRIYSTDGKSRALYTEIVDNLITKSAQNGRVIEIILQEWITMIAKQISEEKNISLQEVMYGSFNQYLEKSITENLHKFEMEGLSYDFSKAIQLFYEGVIKENYELKNGAIRWIRGDISTKTEAKKLLNISNIINDDNWFEAVKSIAILLKDIGYAGLILNIDEVVNIYKLPMRQSRDKNYEKILNIYNECKTDRASNLFVNLGATRKTVFDLNRGMASYPALHGRLGDEKSMDYKLVNTSKTVLPLKPLTNEEIYTLLEHLLDIYTVFYRIDIDISVDEITLYMEEQLNRPGAAEFLTPRAVIKDFLEILDIKRQNNLYSVIDIINLKFGKQRIPVFKDTGNTDDDIEVI